MLDVLVAERKHVAFVQERDKKCPVLTEKQWDEMSDLIEALRPIKELTVVLCGQKYVTMSLVQPLVRKLVTDLRELLSDNVAPSVKPFVRKLNTAIRSRISRDNSDQLKASLLDPRTKTLYFCDGKEQDKIKSLVRVELQELGWEIREKQEAEESKKKAADKENAEKEKREAKEAVEMHVDEDVEVAPAPRKPKDLRALMGLPASGPAPADAVVQLEDELDVYLRMPVCDFEISPLSWWKDNALKLPLLSSLARRYLGAPATATPCERLWSIAGVIVTGRRSNLNNRSVQDIVQLHENLRALLAVGVTWDQICELTVPKPVPAGVSGSKASPFAV